MPGLGVSLFLIAVGAILDFAVTVSPYQHGFNINRVGLILLIIGGAGLVISLIFWGVARGRFGSRHRRTTVEDNRGNVVQRRDSYF
jgi:hypothetical protein